MRYFRLIHLIWIAFAVVFYFLGDKGMIYMMLITMGMTEFSRYCILHSMKNDKYGSPP